MLKNREKLYNYPLIYELNDKNRQVFVRAMRETVEFHQGHCDFYSRLLKKNFFSGEDIRSEDDLERIPFIHANFFKTHKILSLPESKIVTSATSSGTTGQKSEMFFDHETLVASAKMIIYIMRHFNFYDSQLTNYLMFSYEVDENSKLGTANTDIMLTDYAPINNIFFALPNNGKSNEFDIFGSIRALRAFEKDGKPVRILGFPSFLHATLVRMKELEIPPLHLHPDSLVLTGGGWKNHEDKSIPKEKLYEMVKQQLGIKPHRCRDLYATVEHPVPYIECEHHHFHVPIFSRVIIRDVKTLKPVPDGEIGLINFVSPFLLSVPGCSVIMGDLAVKHPGCCCSCGINTPYFEIIGRSGTNKSRSCAISSLDLLKGG